ncbi:MAG: hypothetical protein CMP51_05375 [Flavobacteriales bacterium]|nr:hypothetical protein [Flavobacteriales bacterium]
MHLYIKIAIFLILTSVILGAFGAHKLNDLLNNEQINSFNTGIKYQMIHGISVLILSLNYKAFTKRIKNIVQIMILGTLLFSFSIYLLNIKDLISLPTNFLGPITPIGGALIIISWIMLILNVNKEVNHF